MKLWSCVHSRMTRDTQGDEVILRIVSSEFKRDDVVTLDSLAVASLPAGPAPPAIALVDRASNEGPVVSPITLPLGCAVLEEVVASSSHAGSASHVFATTPAILPPRSASRDRLATKRTWAGSAATTSVRLADNSAHKAKASAFVMTSSRAEDVLGFDVGRRALEHCSTSGAGEVRSLDFDRRVLAGASAVLSTTVPKSRLAHLKSAPTTAATGDKLSHSLPMKPLPLSPVKKYGGSVTIASTLAGSIPAMTSRQSPIRMSNSLITTQSRSFDSLVARWAEGHVSIAPRPGKWCHVLHTTTFKRAAEI